MAGAHPKNFINEPSIDLMKKYLKASKNQIKIVTLAPESNTAFKLIKFLNKNKIRVQIGHTVATDKQIDLAIKSGAKGVTHLYNAIYIHHRNPSVLPYILNQKLTAELITDTFHIDAKMCAFLIQIFSKSIYGVSDCCSALGVDKNSNLKKLTLGSLNIIKKDKIALTKDLNILAGGASWLTEHPFLLKKAFLKNPNIIIPNQEKIFSLYYKIQNKLFIKEIIKLKRNGANFFNQNSYKWLYTTSKP
jgi:N-acetylglucosamine-6-phosphate deacetylase